jgi:hypothetical protein
LNVKDLLLTRLVYLSEFLGTLMATYAAVISYPLCHDVIAPAKVKIAVGGT